MQQTRDDESLKLLDLRECVVSRNADCVNPCLAEKMVSEK